MENFTHAVEQPIHGYSKRDRHAPRKNPKMAARTAHAMSINAQSDKHAPGWESLAYEIGVQAVRDYAGFREAGVIDAHGHETGKWPKKEYAYTIRYQDGRRRKVSQTRLQRILGMSDPVDPGEVIRFFDEGWLKLLMDVAGSVTNAKVMARKMLGRDPTGKRWASDMKKGVK
jgi:hypothetical protein